MEPFEKRESEADLCERALRLAKRPPRLVRGIGRAPEGSGAVMELRKAGFIQVSNDEPARPLLPGICTARRVRGRPRLGSLSTKIRKSIGTQYAIGFSQNMLINGL